MASFEAAEITPQDVPEKTRGSLALASSFNPTASDVEARLYHEMGLGRGVNITDKDMWRDKPAFQVRKCSPQMTNICMVATQDCGVLKSYKNEMSTFAMQQQKLWLSLDDPATHVEIDMDEHYFCSSPNVPKLIMGRKIETRTIYFQSHFQDDIPRFSSVEEACSLVNTSSLQDGESSFEDDLSKWILKRIDDRLETEKKSTIGSSVDTITQSTRDVKLDQDSLKPAKRLEKKLKQLLSCNGSQEKHLKNIVQDCVDFIKSIGITHYVSAIKLGACYFRAVNTRSKQKTIGEVPSIDAGGLVTKQLLRMSEGERKIGRMSDQEVTKEAVIGFSIQPVYTLVKIELIQMALREATKVYIKSEQHVGDGPFLISCEVCTKTVYLTINGRYQLMGTELPEEAAQFYFIPTGDPFHPSDFFIAYRGKQASVPAETAYLDYLYMKQTDSEPPLTHYLSIDTNIFGKCEGPLTFKTMIEIKKARFSLHSRNQFWSPCMLCTTTPVNLSSWLEGEQLYVNCSHRLFKANEFLAVKQNGQFSQRRPGSESSQVQAAATQIGQDTEPYKVTTVTMITESVETGTQFRIHMARASTSVARDLAHCEEEQKDTCTQIKDEEEVSSTSTHYQSCTDHTPLTSSIDPTVATDSEGQIPASTIRAMSLIGTVGIRHAWSQSERTPTWPLIDHDIIPPQDQEVSVEPNKTANESTCTST